MLDMNIRPGGSSGLQLAYAVGRFTEEDDAFVVSRLGGESPLGTVLCNPGSEYAVHVNADGAGRSVLAGLDVTSPRGDGKAWYIRDSRSGEMWSPFFLPMCENADDYEISYLPGQVTAHCLRHKIACTLTIATVPGNTCEIWRVKLENRSADARTLTFTTYAELCIGPELESGYMDKHKTLLLGRPLSSVAAGDAPVRDMVLFHSCTLTPTRFETDKAHFIGSGRTLRNPEHLDSDEQLGDDGISEAPIASLSVEVELPIEGEAEFAFCFGVASSPEQALQTTRAFSAIGNANAAIESALGHWQDMVSTVSVRSMDPGLNALVNTWLPYEAYAGWMKRRTGGVCLVPSRAADSLRRLYPISGTAPDECRSGLIEFANGISVTGAYSPDRESQVVLPNAELLWLPACTARYVAETGDTDLLSERVGLHGEPPLTLREHCERIMRLCLASGEPASGMLQRVLRQWALTDAGSPEFVAYLKALSSRTPARRDRPQEERSLPRRARYFQSVTPALAEEDPAAELAEIFGSDFSPDGDSGAACCVYSVLVESVLGLEPTPQGLALHPNLPASWQECDIVRIYRGDIYLIQIRRSLQPGKKATSIVVDGEPVLGDMLPYFGDGMEHKVDVVVS